MKYTAEQVKKMQQLIYELDVLSLDASIKSKDNELADTFISDIVPDQVNYEDQALLNVNKEILLSYINQLGPRECLVIKHRYGFIDGEYHTLDYIAQLRGVSRERIRQIEIKALRQLKLILQQNKIHDIGDLL